MEQKFVTIEISVMVHDDEKAPYDYHREKPLGKASQQIILPKDSVENGALSLDKILPSVMNVATVNYENDKAELLAAQSEGGAK